MKPSVLFYPPKVAQMEKAVQTASQENSPISAPLNQIEQLDSLNLIVTMRQGNLLLSPVAVVAIVYEAFYLDYEPRFNLDGEQRRCAQHQKDDREVFNDFQQLDPQCQSHLHRIHPRFPATIPSYLCEASLTHR